MDLKDFIKETISSIANATSELQEELKSVGVIVNPPAFTDRKNDFEPDDFRYTVRRVIDVNFDVAVTAESEVAGGGKAGLKVASFEIGGKGEHRRAQESVSRVVFNVPMTLAESQEEKEARELKKQRDREIDDSIANQRSSRSFI